MYKNRNMFVGIIHIGLWAAEGMYVCVCLCDKGSAVGAAFWPGRYCRYDFPAPTLRPIVLNPDI